MALLILEQMTRLHRHAFSGLVLALTATTLTSCAGSQQRIYEQAIKEASVRGPGWDLPLWPLGDGPLSVSTFTEDAELDAHTLYVWVAPTREVWQMCHGKRDAVLALQQILGLPPQKNPQPGNQWRMFVFEMDSRDLFRPCPGGVDPETKPGGPRCSLSSDLDPALDAEFTQFLLQQWWSSHRATVEHGRDPELGYPWTGMGWTYDWDPASKTHRGVSEFVVKKSAVVNNVRTLTPASFCSGPMPVSGK
jgi:hypothetical protein